MYRRAEISISIAPVQRNTGVNSQSFQQVSASIRTENVQRERHVRADAPLRDPRWVSQDHRFGVVFCCVLAISGCRDESDKDNTKGNTQAPTSAPEVGATAIGAQPIPSPSSIASPLSEYSHRPDSVDVRSLDLVEQRTYLIDLLRKSHSLTPSVEAELERIVSGSDWLGFGNPKLSRAALSREECVKRRQQAAVAPADPRCGSPYMVPVFPAGADLRTQPQVCIDQYEFPNLPCEYPIVWVRASEAVQLCAALGKRLCDAHEWEGACADGHQPLAQEYLWSELPKGTSKEILRHRRLTLEHLHNKDRKKSWAYGSKPEPQRCAMFSRKDPSCEVVDFSTCGTNNFPAGSFPSCASESGVYDQHGNVAEHMSIPVYPEEVGGKGWTEMKGSWFAFGIEEPHPDDCHWRAKNWHTTRVTEPESHRNYHLGFRCCRDL